LPNIDAELEKRPHYQRNQALGCKTAAIGAQSRQWVTSEKQNPLTLARFAYTEDVAASIPAPPTIAASSTSHPTAAR
jgi:hypothetical protein